MDDEKWMTRAIELARWGRVSPNPRVGAVLVECNEIIGEGFHETYGGPHAEANTLNDATRRSGRRQFTGATLYCSLEPCCYADEFKHQSPCTTAILAAGISRVVIAHCDPNPKVSGKGVSLLRQKGVVVETGCLSQQAKELNFGFITRMLTGAPLVRMKLAQSLDGRIATATGDSRWITNEAARRYVHELRAESDAVMVGAGTVRTDNPHLTVRYVDGPDPQVIILDPQLSVPIHAHAIRPGSIIFHAPDVSQQSRNAFEGQDVELLSVPRSNDSVHAGGLMLEDILSELGQRQINSLLVEGGGRLATSIIQDALFDELLLFIAPILIGKGVESVNDLHISELQHARHLHQVQWKEIDGQIMFSGWNKDAVCLQEL